MQTLAGQQRRLAAAITGDAPTVEWLSGPAASRGARIEVYRHAYRARLTEALRSNYPVLHRVLGDEAFGALAAGYLQARPSLRPSIRWFGDELVGYLNEVPNAAPHPSLIDLARMEWSLGRSFDSADAAALQPADLMAVDTRAWPGLRFEAHPSVTLLMLDWAVEPAWRAVTDDENAEVEPPEPAIHALLIWRQQLDSRWRSMPDDEAALFRACIAGEPFADLCERAATHAGEGAAALVAGALRRWVEDGLLARFVLASDSAP